MLAPSLDAAEPLDSPQRLADLEGSGLLDSTTIGALHALTRSAHDALGLDTTALITAVTADSQIVVSQASVGGADRLDVLMPLSQSMCKYVVSSNAPYVVVDATADPAHESVVRDVGLGAYVGFPLHGPRGTVLGALCALTAEPRQWSASELQILQSLTEAAEFVVAMIAMSRRERETHIADREDRFARVQHGLRTPLTSLLGLLDLLRDGHLGDFNSAQLEALARCHANTRRLCDEVEALA